MRLPGKKRLGSQFTLWLVLVLLIGTVLSGLALLRQLESIAEDAVGSNGLLLLHVANSVRAYTSNNVDPLVQPTMNASKTFIPESVPAFSARSVMAQMRASSDYRDFVYKEAALNPTLPQDKADAFETQILLDFEHSPSTTEKTGFRCLNGQSLAFFCLNGQMLFYNARPMAISDQKCLACHSTPQAAPAAMVQQYGPDNGFGWKMGQVIATQIVYVPATEVYQKALGAWASVMGIAVASFAIAILLVNLLLRRNVVAPIRQMAGLAEKIGAGNVQEGEAEGLAAVTRRDDELGQMARVFQRMAHEVYTREQNLLKQVEALRIEIDEAKKARQVSEVVDTDTFRDLASRASEMRRRRQQQENRQNTHDQNQEGGT
jgi:HAMP domain-containing protein